jgi:nitrite reductase (NADH) small subunit
MENLVKVAKISDIAPGKSKVVDIDGRPIAVYNTNGTFHATDNYCPHKGGPLNEGTLIGNMVLCPWHRWAFDVTDGKCITNPIAKVSCFEVIVEGEDLLIRI